MPTAAPKDNAPEPEEESGEADAVVEAVEALEDTAVVETVVMGGKTVVPVVRAPVVPVVAVVAAALVPGVPVVELLGPASV